MRLPWPALSLVALLAILLPAQVATKSAQDKSELPPKADASALEGVQQLRLDVQRLQALVNQMRTNLAFVQTSQTPLKHQFEIEADAWQIVIDDMNRRIQRMEQDHGQDRTPQRKLP